MNLAYSCTIGYSGQVKRHSLPFQVEAALKYLVIQLTFAHDCTYVLWYMVYVLCASYHLPPPPPGTETIVNGSVNVGPPGGQQIDGSPNDSLYVPPETVVTGEQVTAPDQRPGEPPREWGGGQVTAPDQRPGEPPREWEGGGGDGGQVTAPDQRPGEPPREWGEEGRGRGTGHRARPETR